MPAIRGPGRILVPSGAGQLPYFPRGHIHHEDLRNASYFAMKSHAETVRRPIRGIRAAGHTVVERGEELLPGTVCRHNVDLRQTRTSGHERDAPPVRAECRGQVIRKPA